MRWATGNKRRVGAVAGVTVVMASGMLLPALADEPHDVKVAKEFGQAHVDYVVSQAGRDFNSEVPPWATDPGYPGQVVEGGQMVAEYGAALATGIAPDVPPWATDPGYPGQVVEVGKAYAEYVAALATGIAPDVPPWATDPGYPGQVVEAGQMVAGYGAALAAGIAPDVPPWATDPDYARKLAEVGKAYAEYVAAEHYGGGLFRGADNWHGDPAPAAEECHPDRAPARGTVSITADVAFSTGTHTFTGPLAISGTACGAARDWTGARWMASGTDSGGNTLHCPYLGGVARWTSFWSANVVGDCTLNGAALSKVQLLLYGRHASTGSASGTMAGALSINTY